MHKYGFGLIFTNNEFLLICIEMMVYKIEIFGEILKEVNIDNQMLNLGL